MFAFEPMTLALGLALIENAAVHPRRACCRARLLLRRAPDLLLDGALNEAAEPLLDTVNTAIFHQAIDAFLLSFVLALCYLMISKSGRC
jgi:hypothetical protein